MKLKYLWVLPISTSLLCAQTWDGVSSNDWNTNSNWATDPAYPNTSTSDVTFTDIAGSNLSPNISSSVTIRDLTFNSSTDVYTLSNSASQVLNLSANSDITQSGSSSVSISTKLDTNSNDIGLGGNGSGLVTLTNTITSNNTLTKSGSSTFFISGVDNESTLGDSTKWVINSGTLQYDQNTAFGIPTSSTADYITLNGGTLSQNTNASSVTLSGKIDFTVGASGGTLDNAGTKAMILSGDFTGSGDLRITSSGGSSDVMLKNGDNTGYTNDFYIGDGSTKDGFLRISSTNAISSSSTIFFDMDSTSNDSSTFTNDVTGGKTYNNNFKIRRKSTGGQLWDAVFQTKTDDMVISGAITTDTTDGSQNHDTVVFSFNTDSNHNITLSGSNDFSNVDNIAIKNSSGSGSVNTLYLNNANALNGFSGTFRTFNFDANTTTRILEQTSAATHSFNWKDNDGYTVSSSSSLSIGGAHSSGTVTYSGNITFDDSERNGSTNYLHSETAGAQTVFSGVIDDGSQSVHYTKTGAGEVVISGANTYDGNTTVSAGTLFVNNSTGSGSGTGTVTVSSGGRIAGSGSFSGLLTANAGSHLAAGSDFYTVGNLNSTHTGSDNLIYGNSSGTYIWNVEDFSGVAGTAWDILSFSGSLNVDNSSGLFNIYIESISSSGTLGLASNQSASASSIKILDTGGAGNFKLGGAMATNALLDSYFQLDDTGYFNGNTSWWLTTDGQSLFLNYQVVPEPSSYFVLLLLVLTLSKKYFCRSSRKRRLGAHFTSTQAPSQK